MRKIILSFIIVIGIIIAIGFINGNEHKYIREVQVINIQDNNIMVRDKDQHYWAFEGKGYTIGQNIKVVMHDNYTMSNISDDKIMGVK